jgi:para-nitrobenzyl esterase
MDRRTFLTAVAGAAATWPFLGEGVVGQTTSGATVETAAGKIRGQVRLGIHSFKGLPYGPSTTGVQRFMAPVKAAPWTGVREASRYGHQSMVFDAPASRVVNDPGRLGRELWASFA